MRPSLKNCVSQVGFVFRIRLTIVELDVNIAGWNHALLESKPDLAQIFRLTPGAKAVEPFAGREIKLPELKADIPDRLRHGKNFPHIAALNSTSAIRWQKDGSLVVEIVYMIDGENGSITATRTVVLGFDRSDKVSIRKSTMEFKTAKAGD